jgi:hypothetical protein
VTNVTSLHLTPTGFGTLKTLSEVPRMFSLPLSTFRLSLSLIPGYIALLNCNFYLTILVYSSLPICTVRPLNPGRTVEVEILSKNLDFSIVFVHPDPSPFAAAAAAAIRTLAKLAGGVGFKSTILRILEF